MVMNIEALRRVSEARALGQNGEGRRWRLQRRITLPELAGALKVDPATLSRWETGQNAPRPEIALRWLGALEALSTSTERSAS